MADPSCSLREVLGLGREWGVAERQEDLLCTRNAFNLHNMKASGGVPFDRSGPEAQRGEVIS